MPDVEPAAEEEEAEWTLQAGRGVHNSTVLTVIQRHKHAVFNNNGLDLCLFGAFQGTQSALN